MTRVALEGQKDSTSELRRLKTMYKKENVDASSLMSVDRYGKLLVLRFSSSIGATVFEIDFKKSSHPCCRRCIPCSSSTALGSTPRREQCAVTAALTADLVTFGLPVSRMALATSSAAQYTG